MRTEDAQIGRLVPGEYLPSPEAAAIGLRQHLAESQHAVEPVEIEAGDRLGIGRHPVVRVVEQKQIAPAGPAVGRDARDQIGRAPFMDDDQIRTIERLVQVERRRVVNRDRQVGIGLAPSIERRLAMLGREIARAPRIRWLPGRRREAPPPPLGENAAQKMRVAVVPVGAQRMAEQDELRHCSARNHCPSPLSRARERRGPCHRRGKVRRVRASPPEFPTFPGPREA